VRGGTILTMDVSRPFVEGDVAVLDGRIVGIGPDLDVTATRTIEARGGAVLPGLVNAHMHECMERGIFEDLPFTRWLNDFALPKDRAYEPRHLRAAALLNQLEMIRNGTTTFIDIFRFPGEAAAIVQQSGLRAVISPQVIDHPVGVGETLEGNLAFVQEWRHRLPDRIHAWFGPHALYSCDPETYQQMAARAKQYAVGLHTHLSESLAEVQQIRERTGLTPAAWLDRLIGDVPRVVLAHCVHVTEADIELIAERGWAVAHCPTSNMKLANGAAPVGALLAAGVTVGLGSDSMMTNNNLDLFEEMRQAALVQKLVQGDATVMPCQSVLAMATMGSARALGLGDEIGSLEIGKRADLIVVGLDQAHLWPLVGNNLVAQLVYSASGSDVRTTIVGGEVLMEEGVVATIDEAEVRELVDRELTDLLQKAGVLHG
jgi:5-methylthioadenosine/S-adenosylhomocysteine deaminase